MKLIYRSLEKDSSGELKLVAEDAEDMWHAYNLIACGDRLTTTALRKVKKESSTGIIRRQAQALQAYTTTSHCIGVSVTYAFKPIASQQLFTYVDISTTTDNNNVYR